MLPGVATADDLSLSPGQQFAMYRKLKLLFYNEMIQVPGDVEGLVKELRFLNVVNNRRSCDVCSKDRVDALATVAWSAAGQQLPTDGQLV